MKWDIADIDKWEASKHPPAATIPEAGNAKDYDTGSWRSSRPIHIEDKCTHCLFCFIYCPDSSIIVEDSKVVGLDLKHCKGCGICARECPVDAIEMKDEAAFKLNSK